MTEPQDFLKCPNCHRTATVKFTIHTDGDCSFRCLACDTYAGGRKLHESSRVYSKATPGRR
jgi:hypothetical protein